MKQNFCYFYSMITYINTKGLFFWVNQQNKP